MLPLSFAPPAQADRTGKYSTKLTAKRRYVPRIEKGISALSLLNVSAANWQADVESFAKDEAQDLRTAMELFATMYFSEGNKIGVKERELAECVHELFKGLNQLKSAAERGDMEGAGSALSVTFRGVNRYVQIAQLEDKIKLLNVASPVGVN